MFERLVTLPFFIIALVVHESAHALVADRLGDPTPRSDGRLSLNPLRHLDPLGTVMILLTGFGWAKPVVIDNYNLARPRRDTGIISLAGPVSNLVFASFLGIIYRYHLISIPTLASLVSLTAQVNIMLAIFNLVPVYPLDGEKILAAVLPRDLAYEYQAVMSRYGTIILIFMILPLFGSSPVISLISPAITFISHLLLG